MRVGLSIVWFVRVDHNVFACLIDFELSLWHHVLSNKIFTILGGLACDSFSFGNVSFEYLKGSV